MQIYRQKMYHIKDNSSFLEWPDFKINCSCVLHKVEKNNGFTVKSLILSIITLVLYLSFGCNFILNEILVKKKCYKYTNQSLQAISQIDKCYFPSCWKRKIGQHVPPHQAHWIPVCCRECCSSNRSQRWWTGPKPPCRAKGSGWVEAPHIPGYCAGKRPQTQSAAKRQRWSTSPKRTEVKIDQHIVTWATTSEMEAEPTITLYFCLRSIPAWIHA